MDGSDAGGEGDDRSVSIECRGRDGSQESSCSWLEQSTADIGGQGDNHVPIGLTAGTLPREMKQLVADYLDVSCWSGGRTRAAQPASYHELFPTCPGVVQEEVHLLKQ